MYLTRWLMMVLIFPRNNFVWSAVILNSESEIIVSLISGKMYSRMHSFLKSTSEWTVFLKVFSQFSHERRNVNKKLNRWLFNVWSLFNGGRKTDDELIKQGLFL